MSAKKTAKPKKKVAKKKARAKAKPAKKAVKKTVKKPAKKKAVKKAAKKKVVKKTTKRPVKKTAPKKKVKKAAKKTAARKPAAKARPKPKPKKTVAKKKAPAKAPAKAKPKPKKTVAKKKAPAKAPAKAKAKATSKDKTATAVKPVPAPAPAPAAKTKAKTKKRRASRRAAVVRRGPDGEILAPGDLLLPGGTKGIEEIQYLFRGCMAAERPATDTAIDEILTRRAAPEGPGEREELQGELTAAQERFGKGDLEPVIPARTNLRRTFEGVVDRARQRRREIGAFLRGLDMGHTETSHMDAHGEASLQSLMEWAARLENLVENLTEVPDANQGHYVQFHRVLDQLEASTEALIIDVEQTLRRLRDRLS